MAQKRDRILEIAEIKARRGNTNKYLYRLRLEELNDKFESDPNDLELLRYYVVSNVTLLEVYIRSCIQELIDHGKPFSENAEALSFQTKFDLRVLNAIQGKTITPGDFMSHLVPISSLSDIISCLSVLMGLDFWNAIKNVHSRWDVEVHKKPKAPIISDSANLYQILSKLFSTRHILVHEVPQEMSVGKEDVSSFFSGVRDFMRACDQILENQIAPDAPLTQSARTQAASEAYDQCRSELNDVLNTYRELYLEWKEEEGLGKFNEAQESWEVYLQKEAGLAADYARGGSLSHQLYFMQARTLAEARIRELRERLRIDRERF